MYYHIGQIHDFGIRKNTTIQRHRVSLVTFPYDSDTHMSSFDIEFPAECDDEYWMDPISPMQQPPGTKPSLLCFFNHQLSLTGIMALALRLNKDARISDKEVSELGEKLQRWFNDIPEHRMLF